MNFKSQLICFGTIAVTMFTVPAAQAHHNEGLHLAAGIVGLVNSVLKPPPTIVVNQTPVIAQPPVFVPQPATVVTQPVVTQPAVVVTQPATVVTQPAVVTQPVVTPAPVVVTTPPVVFPARPIFGHRPAPPRPLPPRPRPPRPPRPPRHHR